MVDGWLSSGLNDGSLMAKLMVDGPWMSGVFLRELFVTCMARMDRPQSNYASSPWVQLG